LGKIHSVTTDPERNATVVTHTTWLGLNVKTAVYRIRTNNKELYVYESFRPDESETVPILITILGKESGKYYSVTLRYLSARPTMAELSSIDIREYIKTEVS